MRKYFIHNGNIEEGPFNLEELMQKKIIRSTPVWFEGLEKWTTASKIVELDILFVPNSIPPPLIKPINENSKEDIDSTFTHQTYSNPKKKSFLVPFLVGGLVLTAAIIIFLAFQNSTNSDSIDNLQDKFSAQQGESSVKEEERQRINKEITEKNKKYRNNWNEYISVSNNNFTTREIGGIFNLEIVITNDTEYMIDEVELEVRYVKENGEDFKSEIVRIYNIPANYTKSQSAPDSERGKSIEMNINSILSKKMHFCYQPGNWANNSEDPYFCK